MYYRKFLLNAELNTGEWGAVIGRYAAKQLRVGSAVSLTLCTVHAPCRYSGHGKIQNEELIGTLFFFKGHSLSLLENTSTAVNL